MFQSGEIEAAVVADFAVDIIQGAAENVEYVVQKAARMPTIIRQYS